jgi:hypothetical protein
MNRIGNGPPRISYTPLGEWHFEGFMPVVPPIARTKKRRDKLLASGLIEKNVWVPAIFAAHLAAFALELRRRAAAPHRPGFGWPADLRRATTAPADRRRDRGQDKKPAAASHH